MTKQIPLSQGKLALIDDEDYAAVSQFKWCCSRKGYAVSNLRTTPKGQPRKYKTIMLHRIVNNTPDDAQTDHVNGDKLDNRKCNLRTCTHSQNAANAKAHSKSVSKYKGVSWSKRHQCWQSQIQAEGIKKTIGLFYEEDDAAIAYNEVAVLMFGEFAKLNEVTDAP